jgi:hypothetical protein
VSVEAYNAVWKYFEGTQRQRVTMLALANRADEHGIAWPSIEELQRKTKMKRATVYEVLREIEKTGQLVTLEGGGGRGNTTLRWLKLPTLDGDTSEAEQRMRKRPVKKGPNSRNKETAKPSGPPDEAATAKGPDTRSKTVRKSGPAPYIGVKPSKEQSVQPTTGGGVTAEDPDTAIEEIFEFWKSLTGRNGDTRLTEKRLEAGRARLAEGFTPKDLRRAVLGCVRSDWHMKRGRWADRDEEVKDELASIFYDADSIERLKDIAGKDAPEFDGSPDPITDLGRAQPVWEAAKKALEGMVPEATYNLWIQPLEVAGFRQSGRMVLVDNAERASWQNRRYRTLIGEALEAVGAGTTDVEVIDEKTLELEAA